MGKCAKTECIKFGDIVKATRRLNFSHGDDKGCVVDIGALGILKKSDGSKRGVEWINRRLGLCMVQKDGVAKCIDIEYIKVGDIVKATRRLSFARGDDKGCNVDIGALGVLKKFDGSKCSVEWTGRTLGLCMVEDAGRVLAK